MLGFVALMVAALWNFRLNRKRDAALRADEAVPTVNRSRNTWIGFLAFFLSKGDRPPFLRPKPPYSYPGAPHQRPRCDLGHLRLLQVEGRRPQGGET